MSGFRTEQWVARITVSATRAGVQQSPSVFQTGPIPLISGGRFSTVATAKRMQANA